jgi:pilus assembly protein CpaB
MAKLNNRSVIIIALILAAVAAGVSYMFISGIFGTAGKMVPVLTAAQDIPLNTTITKEMLTVKNIPEAFAHPQAYSTVEQATGKTSKVPILKDEYIMPNIVAAKDKAGNRFSYKISDKQRAITLAVNEVSGVGGFPEVGDRVDILLTRDTAGTTYTGTLFQYKEILATGSMTVPTEDGKQKIVPTITLSLSPSETQQITLAESTGRLKFTLRPPVDREIVSIEAASFKK